jgi:hypothetical protein
VMRHSPHGDLRNCLRLALRRQWLGSSIESVVSGRPQGGRFSLSENARLRP